MIRALRLANWFGALITIFTITLVGCSSSAGVADDKAIVVVAGATGGTGRALVSNLLDQGFAVRAFVRDADKARTVLGDEVTYATGDVRQIDTILPALEGASYLISSIGASRTDPTNNPEAVDFGGVKNMADAAAASGIKQFVLVSSSGVTQKDHFLNKAFNNVLLWKFAGEEAVRDSGVPYTIVRPGGLVNKPGGMEAMVFAQGDTVAGTISREDVALICIAALQQPASINTTFEVYSSGSAGSNDWTALFGSLIAD